MVTEIEFEIINIEDMGHRFVVEYEITETRERKKHGFPKGNGWMDKNYLGEYKFIKELRRMIAKENECKLDTQCVCDCANELKGTKIKVTSNDL